MGTTNFFFVKRRRFLKRLGTALALLGIPEIARPAATSPEVPPRDPPIRVRKSVPHCWVELELIEGRNRQVRRMTAAIGHPTLRLMRVRIGGLELRELPAGKWRGLDASQRRLVQA